MLGWGVLQRSLTYKVTGLVRYHCCQKSNGKVLTSCTASSPRLQVPNRSRNRTAPLAPSCLFHAFTCSREFPIDSDRARPQIVRKGNALWRSGVNGCRRTNRGWSKSVGTWFSSSRSSLTVRPVANTRSRDEVVGSNPVGED